MFIGVGTKESTSTNDGGNARGAGKRTRGVGIEAEVGKDGGTKIMTTVIGRVADE